MHTYAIHGIETSLVGFTETLQKYFFPTELCYNDFSLELNFYSPKLLTFSAFLY